MAVIDTSAVGKLLSYIIAEAVLFVGDGIHNAVCYCIDIFILQCHKVKSSVVLFYSSEGSVSPRTCYFEFTFKA